MASDDVKTALSPGEVLDRLKEVYGVETDTQLARTLRLAQTTVSNWRNRKTIPFEHCVEAAFTYGTSLDYLLLGRKAKAKHKFNHVDLEMLRLAADHAEKLERQKFPFVDEPNWQRFAKIYNAWCEFLDANSHEGETRSQILDKVKDFGGAFMLVPEEVMAEHAGGGHTTNRDDQAVETAEVVDPRPSRQQGKSRG